MTDDRLSPLIRDAAQPVAEWDRPSRAVFEAEIAPMNRPAILRGVFADWPAVRLATDPQALAAFVGPFGNGTPVNAFRLPAAADGRIGYTDDLTGFNFERLSIALPELLSAIGSWSDGDDIYYAGGVNVPAHLPDFAIAHQNPFIDQQTEHLMSVWLGGPARVPAHWDLPRNIAGVVMGRRRFTLFPIEQIPNLYIGPIDRTPAGQPCSLVDFYNPDTDQFPKFSEAARHAVTAELDPGDALYIPSLWVHHVENLSPMGMLVNFWWRDGPAHMFTPTLTMMHALLSIRDMPKAERLAWRHLFDHYIFQTGDDPVAHIPEQARGVLGEMTPQRVAELQRYLKDRL